MKNFITTLLLVFAISLSLKAQERPPHFKNNDKIKALKTAYITNALDLTSKEAEKFWPIYNTYDKKIMDLRFKKMHELRNKIKSREDFNALSGKDATKLLNDFLNIERSILNAKSNLNQQLLKVISAKKILKLYKTEDDFNKRLLQRLRGSRNNESGRFKRN